MERGREKGAAEEEKKERFKIMIWGVPWEKKNQTGPKTDHTHTQMPNSAAAAL